MKLRVRLALALAAAALPLVAGAVWLRQDLAGRAAFRFMREFAMARMEAGGRERCVQRPERFSIVVPPREPADPGDAGDFPDFDEEYPGSRDRVTEIWAYGPDLRSANPLAPPIPQDLAEEMREGGDDAGRDVEFGGNPARVLVLRTPWPQDPCAFLLVRRTYSQTSAGSPFPLSGMTMVAVVVLALVAAVIVAIGPVVRRIRQLTQDMRRSASERYAKPVQAGRGDEIAELADAFNEASAEARRHIEMLEQREETLRSFIANTTHDVMTPLTVLQGHLSAIHRRAAEGRPPDVEVAKQAVEDAHYLASLVHNLGAAAKLEGGGTVQLAPLRLDDVVRRVVERHWPVASPRAIEIEFAVPEQPVWVKADVTLLEQAIGNVVANAVRYNHPGGHVAVILEERPSAQFSLRVVDDGPGVPEDQLARLGERGFRTDEARRLRPKGTGLGLSIARRVAETHGLALDFRRSEHGGLEVEFRGRHGTPRRVART